MSLVIAEVRDGVVHMGADTQIGFGKNYKVTRTCESQLKIAKMPYGVLVGFAGKVINADILIAHKEWFADLERDKLTKEFIATKIVPRFYRELKRSDSLEKTHPVCTGTTFLIAQEDRLFFMDDDFGVFVVPKFGAIGCGNDAALTVHEMNGDAPVRDKLLQALRLAEQFDNAIGAPFVFIDTQSFEYEFTEE